MAETHTHQLPASTMLAIDSSTDVLSLAVQTSQGCWQRDIQGAASASSQILQELDAFLAAAKIKWDAIDLLVCGRGPGAFTGLRVAIAVSQGLAQARGLPLMPISGLLAIAETARETQGEAKQPQQLWALQDARMGQAYAAQCSWNGRSWELGEEQLLDYAQVAQLPSACAGNLRATFSEANLPLPEDWCDAQPNAAALLRLAGQALQAGISPLHNPTELLPVYVHNKVAQTIAERGL